MIGRWINFLGWVIKSKIYRHFPSSQPWLHKKRRKGLQRSLASPEVLECQLEQDRIFLDNFLQDLRPGFFWEVGCGDGTTGSCTLVLETIRGWKGILWETLPLPRRSATKRRTELVLETPNPDVMLMHPLPDLLFIRRPVEFPWVWTWLEQGKIRPRWSVVENPQPHPNWVLWLESRNYRLRWFFHDDEYFERNCH